MTTQVETTAAIKAAEFLLPRFRERAERNEGVPWRTPKDTDEVMKRFGMSKQALGAVFTRAAKELGIKEIDIRRQHAEEIQTLLDLFRQHGVDPDGPRQRVVTAEMRAAFEKKHPGQRASGGIIKAVWLRYAPGSPVSGPRVPGIAEALTGLTESASAVNMFNRYQKLLNAYEEKERQRNQLDAEMDELKKEMAHYRPIAAAIENMRTAVKKVKDAEEQAAQEQRQTPF